LIPFEKKIIEIISNSEDINDIFRIKSNLYLFVQENFLPYQKEQGLGGEYPWKFERSLEEDYDIIELKEIVMKELNSNNAILTKMTRCYFNNMSKRFQFISVKPFNRLIWHANLKNLFITGREDLDERFNLYEVYTDNNVQVFPVWTKLNEVEFNDIKDKGELNENTLFFLDPNKMDSIPGEYIALGFTFEK